jgi:Ala-tRNA(Pro) deacylase
MDETVTFDCKFDEEELGVNIQEFLGRYDVAFDVLPHHETYEAQRMAQAVHVSGHHVAKTVLIRVGEPCEYVVVVLPASRNIDFEKAQKVFVAEKIELANESEISQKCPDCDVGALPPFGSHYNMITVVDDSLTRDDEIVFEGRLHSESIRMKFADFARLESPMVVSVSR